MAISVAVAVGNETADILVAKLKEELAGLKVGNGRDNSNDMGPLITGPHRDKVSGYIDLGVEEGAELAVDGRGLSVDGHEEGFFLGGTLFDHVTPEMKIYNDEIFGPVSFIIKGRGIEDCLADATGNARECGAITSHVYSRDEAFLEKAIDAYHDAGASVACNLVGMPINFAAAYSDYHVTGLNPAGTACLTDLAFVASRFRIVQSKRMI